MTRVLHLTTTAVSLDWLLAPQLKAFAAAGYDVVTASAPGDHVDAVRARGLRHVEVPSLSRNVNPAADRAAWTELCQLFTKERPDIVHTHNPKPGVLGRVAARRSGVPIVVNTVHGLYAQPSDSLARRVPVFAAERFAAAFSDAELVQNPEDVALLRSLRVPSQRIHLLGNGIDLDHFSASRVEPQSSRALRYTLGIAPSTPIVGVVGRLVWEKGYRELFDAVKLLRRRSSNDFAVVVVGPAEPEKSGAVDEDSIAEMTSLGVHFLGSRTDVNVLLSLFDLFVLPSHREGYPRSAMEASAMGLPVIATDIRGCRQVVDVGVSGLLVPVGDHAALAGAIESLLANPLRRKQLGGAAIRRAHAEFDHNRVISRTLGVYRSLLRSKNMPIPDQPAISRYIDSIDLVAAEASNRPALERAA